MNDEHQQFGVAVKGVVVKDGKYLILKKSSSEDINPNTFDLPGGRIKFGEKLEEAIVREVKEETELDVKPLCVINAWTFTKDESFQLTGIDFLCKYLSGEEKLSKEHEEYFWLDASEIEKTTNLPSWIVETIQKTDPPHNAIIPS